MCVSPPMLSVPSLGSTRGRMYRLLAAACSKIARYQTYLRRLTEHSAIYQQVSGTCHAIFTIVGIFRIAGRTILHLLVDGHHMIFHSHDHNIFFTKCLYVIKRSNYINDNRSFDFLSGSYMQETYNVYS